MKILNTKFNRISCIKIATELDFDFAVLRSRRKIRKGKPAVFSRYEETKRNLKKKKEKEKKQGQVRLSRPGCEWLPIHRCYPTTVWRGSFCLLCFHPGPVRSSLTNLENADSSMFPILTPNLARTPDLHRTTAPRNPDLKPFKHPSLQAAGLQACATTPGWQTPWEI